MPVGKPRPSVRVGAVDPIAQGLPLHARTPCRIFALVPVQHQSQRQQAPGHSRIARPPPLLPKISRRVLAPRLQPSCPPPPSCRQTPPNTPKPDLLTFESERMTVGMGPQLPTSQPPLDLNQMNRVHRIIGDPWSLTVATYSTSDHPTALSLRRLIGLIATGLVWAASGERQGRPPAR